MKTYFSTNRVLASAALGLGMMTVFFACKKDNKNDANTTSNVVATNNAIAAIGNESTASASYSDVFEVGYQGTSSVTDDGRTTTATTEPSQYYGYTYTVVPVMGWPKTFTLDFGDGSVGQDGNTRSGKIIVNMPHAFAVPGNTIEITTENYTVNGIKVEGTETLTNNSNQSALNFNQLITGSITVDDTTSFDYSSTKNLIVDNDGFKLLGNAKLVYPTGDSASITITDTLVKNWSCAHIAKGKATITRGKISGTIDYGNGICDDSATVVVGNNTKYINIW
ncbi:hypothetical protein GA0116948_106115 [Chitinophaga costaii]|uniref:Lipoprotein n=1 Tax=Chitinophaga costaii TaxID=1335309 RepID=A0A1C4DUJ3_9BACT|nr:hypothetical protein [Chitinophaga costaii]PUZ27797.1 hypothetical protein DCM91_06210 [Chitinophaga costaii]SCC34940.1 hypothetical protein GA0116948_106115 [Chitinophaga costaii]